MAAISTTLLAFLSKGDHIVLTNEIYGGAFNFVVEEFDKMGIEYSFTDGVGVADFEAKIKSNTKVIYIETPSNPLLTITDIRGVRVGSRHWMANPQPKVTSGLIITQKFIYLPRHLDPPMERIQSIPVVYSSNVLLKGCVFQEIYL